MLSAKTRLLSGNVQFVGTNNFHAGEGFLSQFSGHMWKVFHSMWNSVGIYLLTNIYICHEDNMP